MSVNYELDGHVARVTIDRPDQLNAVDLATQDRLIAIWDEIERDRTVRVVVLTGSGTRAFCAGADLKSTSDKTGVDYWASLPPSGFGGIATRTTLDVPVIARVSGYALGGGLEMLLGCDIIIASSNASFGLPEPRVGRLALTGGVTLLSRRIPHVHAMGMLLTGRRIDAAEALEFGLINEVVPPEVLDAAVERWVTDVLACAPLSLKATKQMLRAAERVGPNDANMLRLPALIAAFTSADQAEGVLAFRQKRAPAWRGV